MSDIGSFVTPPAALDPDFVTQQILLNGQFMGSDISEAVIDGQLDRTILGASTFTLTVADPTRNLLRSQLFQSAVTVQLDGLSFTLVELQKQGDQLMLTFEDTIVNRLRLEVDSKATATTAITRAQFVEQLVNQVPGITANVYDSGEPYQATSPLARKAGESRWDCMQRLANEIQERCFSDGEQIFFGPDSWLMSQPSLATVQENADGVDFIDFDFDVGKPISTATVNCIADLWAVPPGRPLTFAGMGVADGVWLVEDISRSIFVKETVITCTQPVAALSEASLASTSTGGISDAVALTGTAGADSVGAAVVNFAVSALGVPYVWGGTSRSGYDCSGLAQAAYKNAGVSIPRTSEAQWAAGPKVNPPYQPGDLIFFAGSDGTVSNPGHVGIYVGNGQMIDAPYTGVNVRYDSIGGTVGATRPR